MASQYVEVLGLMFSTYPDDKTFIHSPKMSTQCPNAVLYVLIDVRHDSWGLFC